MCKGQDSIPSSFEINKERKEKKNYKLQIDGAGFSE
jgi:hypothetical protein